jgi:L-amino acid N-acyltransferase YncA
MSRLFVYDLGLPVGQLRLDRVAPDLVDISFSVHPTFHGKGVGRYLLEHASALVPPEWQARWLRGFVLEDNLASLRLFETTGFQGSSCPRADGLKCRVYQRPLSSVEGCQAEGVSIA